MSVSCIHFFFYQLNILYLRDQNKRLISHSMIKNCTRKHKMSKSTKHQIFNTLQSLFIWLCPSSHSLKFNAKSNYGSETNRLIPLFRFHRIHFTYHHIAADFPRYIHPNVLVNLKEWYIGKYGDQLFTERPSFFIGLVWLDIFFQRPQCVFN